MLMEKGMKMKRTIEEIMNLQFIVTSDCCGEHLPDLYVDKGICPCCLEHCEIVVEEV